MKATLYIKHPDKTAGTWWKRPSWRSPMVCCKSCGMPDILVDYRIEKHGYAKPDFVCTNPGCNWTGPIRLAGWKS